VIALRAARRSWVAPVVVILLATLAGVYFATQLHLAYPEPFRKPLVDALRINLVYYWLWAAAVPLVVLLGRRFRFERGRLALAIAVHAVASVALTVAQVTLAALILGADPSMSLSYNFHSSLPTYWLILAGFLAVRAIRLQEELARAQLQTLQMQLDPHFLFNTLNSISSLTYSDPDAADEMIGKLGGLLRATLEKRDAPAIPLAEELALLERYLDIEEIRFEERLRVAIDVDDAARAAPVPAFLLQPLVENAVRHAVAPRAEGGTIALAARVERGRLRITLRDDGPGLAAPLREGVGLANTRARVERLGGAMTVRDAPGGGVEVALELPA
jgi:signal transduction histidine kinase